VTVPKIGYQDGIEATRQNLNKLDPGKAAYDKLAATLETLKDGHNSTLDRLAALEARPVVPFPAGS
jgi:hypothetical protein